MANKPILVNQRREFLRLGIGIASGIALPIGLGGCGILKEIRNLVKI